MAILVLYGVLLMLETNFEGLSLLPTHVLGVNDLIPAHNNRLLELGIARVSMLYSHILRSCKCQVVSAGREAREINIDEGRLSEYYCETGTKVCCRLWLRGLY